MKISIADGHLIVPDFPDIAYIEGDGVGKEITASMRSVLDAAVRRA